MKNQNLNKKTAFTLIEMLAVLFIIGIIFSITTPAIGPMLRTLKLTTSSENLANALESARQYATTSGQDCRVVVPTTGDLSYRAYKLYSYDGATGNTIGKLEILPNNIQIGGGSSFLGDTMSIPFPEDNSSSQTVAYINFEPDGSATEGGNVYITDPDTGIFQKITYSELPREVVVKEIGDDS